MPVIKKLSNSDNLFKQFSKAVEENDMLYYAGKNQFLEFFLYECEKYDTLLNIHAATGIPYDTLASLNSINGIKSEISGKKLILPTSKGIFVCENPSNSVEVLLKKEFSDDSDDCINIKVDGKEMFFLPGKRFSPTQRTFFLDSEYRLPLDSSVVSSSFGYRKSPVYGTWKFHKGIDFAAPEGDNVYACKRGKVEFVQKNNEIFGNYIIISHDFSVTSVYAHLLNVFVSEGDVVSSGQIIGEVGKTGMTTGPHLHFEIRENGIASNPSDFLPKK